MNDNQTQKPSRTQRIRSHSSRAQAKMSNDISLSGAPAEAQSIPPRRPRSATRRPVRPSPPEERLEAAYERLGTRTPRCQHCGETNPFALTGTFPEILCAAGLAQRTGKADIERHHPAGQHNLPVKIPIPLNDHRILNDRQRDWPEETLKNPQQNPLLKAAGALRGWIDILKLVIERCIGWIPAMLESLNAWLTSVHGPQWWEDWGWEGAA